MYALTVLQNNKQVLQNCCNHFTPLYFTASLHSTSSSSISLVRKQGSFGVRTRGRFLTSLLSYPGPYFNLTPSNALPLVAWRPSGTALARILASPQYAISRITGRRDGQAGSMCGCSSLNAQCNHTHGSKGRLHRN